MPTYSIRTPGGEVHYIAEDSDPDVLLIHGFKRSVAALFPWAERIPGLGFVKLPGHGGAPELGDVSVKAWIEGLRAITARLPRPPVLIGESLGALVALSLGGRAVVAVEPLLSVDNLWPLHQTIRSARARGVVIGPEYEALFAEPFDWVLAEIKAPALVLAGDIPLLPERAVTAEPSLLTEADFDAYARHPQVEARRIAGGHNLLDLNPQGVLAAAADFLAAHGVRTVS